MFQPLSGWLNSAAPVLRPPKVKLISVTLLTSHTPIGWLNLDEFLNVWFKLKIFEVFQFFIESLSPLLNDSAP